MNINDPSTGVDRDVQLAAVIVSYNPPVDFRPRLRWISGQLAHTWVIDNGSGPATRMSPEEMPSAATVVSNPSNMGVAAAQNQGIRLAHERGYPWVLLLDQDTALTQEFLRIARAAIASVAGNERIALLAPSYEDRGRRLQQPDAGAAHTGLSTFAPIDIAISSGSLVRVSACLAVGCMDSRLFIDYVDFDFLIRLNISRYQAMTLPAVIQHSVGNARDHTLLFWRMTTSNHPAARLFSAGRNVTVLTRRYHQTHGKLLWGFWRAEIKRLLKIAMFEADAWRKIGAFFCGVIEASRFGDTRDVGQSKYYRQSWKL